ncbi:hypothetical protein LV164_000079 [Aspergillus fumigatus]|nr:hypothetical protein KXX57_007170 [Aspergillus fumigatus]KAH1985947.1 hypothetical protein KXW88_008699 [Aspergillus fumigatus]KAH2667960.1 hypothetical protein KXV32_005600 [Aspergillus fumigatus]KAH3521915.1 hypothetical protein KXV64_005948 [Aspergillus fumigatus]KAJ8185125.1 hypothetical protein LV157_005593 [Aspergillus fumigatus]
MGKLTSTIGIPIKLLNEAQGHVVTLEITSGVVYRGKLLEAEDNMNVQLKDITVTARDGRVSHLDQVYIRGSHVKFFIVPDMLRNAPMFRSRGQRGRGVGLARDIKTLSDSRPAQAEPPSPEMTMTSPPDLNSASAPRIRNPRRLLILSPSSHSTSTIPSFLHSLTETPVADPPASFAGYTTHPPLRLTNRYYTADIPIWVDEIPLQTATDERTRTQTAGEGESAAPPSPAQWAVEFSGEDARVVRDAIGALVICIRNLEDRSASLPAGAGTGTDAGAGAGSPESRNDVKSLKEFLAAVGRVKGVIEEERAEVGDVPVLLVLVGGPRGHNGARVRGEEGDLEELDGESVEPFSVGWWEDQLFEMGMVGVEVLEWDPTGEEGEERNVYGEYQGMRRIREILETNDWAAPSEDAAPGGISGDGLEEHLLGLDCGENGFDLEVNELEREMLGLRMAIEHGGDGGEDQDEDEDNDDGLKVESLEALMMRMQAIRDMSSELPESERKKFAVKAVRDIMKEL